MSVSDTELVLFVAPWMAFGFTTALILALLFDVRGAIAAFCLGGLAPALTYVPPSDFSAPDVATFVKMGLGLLRAPIPFVLATSGDMVLVELALDWWLGAALGASLGIHLRRRRLA